MNINKKVFAFTIIAQNYYAQAEVLAKSYHQHHPDHDFFVFFVDDKCIPSANYKAISLTQVENIPDFNELCFKYSLMELSTAVKPFIFSWFFNKKEHPDQILYIDPDICFYKPIDKVFLELETHDCVLIPHRTSPTNDKKHPDEWSFMACGYYNLGFVALTRNNQVLSFLKWWGNQLRDYAYSDTDHFMFTDQKWMDYAPSFLDTFILRDKGYDTAYWNLHEYVGLVPINNIYFFHFSGFIPEKNVLSKHQDRFTLENIGDYKKLFNDYAKKLSFFNNQHPEINQYHYPYANFDNGVEISPQIKGIYRYLTQKNELHFIKLFETKPKGSFFSFLSKFVIINDKTKIVNFFLLLNESVNDVHREFPLDQPYNIQLLETYLNWALTIGKSIYRIPEYFIRLQKRIHRTHTVFAFGTYIPLNVLETIFSLETNKRKQSNPDFIISSYKIILHRSPDHDGFNKNLKELNLFRTSRNLFLARLFNSTEFTLKHGRLYTHPILFYYLYLLTLSSKFLFFDRHFLKRKSRQISDVSHPAINIPEVNTLGCNISGYFDTESGVGESGRGLVRALQNANIPLNLNNIEQPWLRRNDKTFINIFTQKNNFPINLICVNADQLIPVLENNFPKGYVKNKYNIGYWYWESDIFPDNYQNSFSVVNEVWTATSFVQQAISAKSPKPIICIPPVFIPPQSKIKPFSFPKYDCRVEHDDFLFLNLFDSASFWQRKNPFALMKAFTLAFKGKKNIKLIIKTTQIAKTDIYKQFQKALDQNKQIILIDSYLENQEVTSLLNRANAYVSLHRAEGLGIPLINAHLLKKPVISTSYSGNRDFENEGNSFPVNYQPFILKEAIGPYEAGSYWADPDIDHAAFQMKKLYEMDQKTLDLITLQGFTDVVNHFSPSRITKLIENRLQIINNTF
ncbi:glycosyltransferase [Patescibacteria group bacterium]|nr:glycosyltransferase [Patescibacteria group bacterium]